MFLLVPDLLPQRSDLPAGVPARRKTGRHGGEPTGPLPRPLGPETSRKTQTARPGRALHPEERAQVHAGQGLALVASPGARHPAAQRAQDRGGAAHQNGESFVIIMYLFFVTYRFDSRNVARNTDARRLRRPPWALT